MADDAALKDHQTWIKYLQPEGLVVSARALVDSQVVLDRAQLARIQQEFLPFSTEFDVDDKTVKAIRSLPEFFIEFLKWPKEALLGIDADRPIPQELIVDLPEFGASLKPDFVLCKPSPAVSSSQPERASNASRAEGSTRSDSHPYLILIKELPPGMAFDDAHTG